MQRHEISPKISILIPCYNEEKFVQETINQCIGWCTNRDVQYEIIIVDDCSSDSTPSKLAQLAKQDNILIIRHAKNKGKGACIRSALEFHKGEIILIQDSDGEYQPKDYDDILEPLLSGRADVVYGSRFIGGKPKRSIYFQYAVGNKLLTATCNLFTGLNLTDMETGYKAIKSTFIKQVSLEQDRFGIEPEITIKLSKIPGIRFYEVGIAYFGRSFEEGKKIRWWDGALAFYYIIKYSLFYSSPRINISK